MTHRLLLPNKFKKIGWIILIPAFIFGLLIIIKDFEFLPIQTKVLSVYSNESFSSSEYFGWITVNITNTIVGVLFIIGALFVGFSKEKQEDEYIGKVRLDALLWAVLVNYSLLLLAFLFIYGFSFLNVMVYNMFTVLIIFIVRFNYVLYRKAKLN